VLKEKKRFSWELVLFLATGPLVATRMRSRLQLQRAFEQPGQTVRVRPPVLVVTLQLPIRLASDQSWQPAVVYVLLVL
jgi:hypothetical protein